MAVTLTPSPPYSPGDRIKHIATGILGGVIRVTMGATPDSWSITVKLDDKPYEERTFAAWCLAPAPKHVAFACITNPLRASATPPAARNAGTGMIPPAGPGGNFPAA